MAAADTTTGLLMKSHDMVPRDPKTYCETLWGARYKPHSSDRGKNQKYVLYF